MKNKLPANPLALAWRAFRAALGMSVNRDTAMMSVAQQCLAQIDQYNQAAAGPPPDATDGMNEEGMDYMDQCHWFQDLYVANDGSLFCITNLEGRLYKWAVNSAADGTVTLDEPTAVQPVYATAQRDTLSKIEKRLDGRYEGFAILGTAALNKDGVIDSRALFDCFIERFTGQREYVNIYHLGGEKTKIGVIDLVFREGNLLVGHYVLDDNPVANAAGATLAADENGKWGGSIEFWSDDDGEQIEVADDIKATMYTRGTLEGFSLAYAQHGAAWGTSHYMTRTPEMNDVTLAAVNDLLGNSPEAVAQFQSWLTDRDLRLSGAITRTSDQPESPVETPVEQVAEPVAEVPVEVPVEQVAEEVEQAVAVNQADMAPPDHIVVDDQLLAAVTSALQNSDWFKAFLAHGEQINKRLDDLEAALAEKSDQPTAEPQAPAISTQTVDSIEARLTAIEQQFAPLASFYERSKPATPVVQTATYRPGRTQDKTPKTPVTQTAVAAPVVVAVPPTTAPKWKRPSKTLDRIKSS